MKSGVPQGYILGPTLSPIFVNNLPDYLGSSMPFYSNLHMILH